MGTYILKRLLQSIPVLFLLTAIVFTVVYLIPGDAAMVVLGQGSDPKALAAVRARMGLDKPAPVRYAIWLKQVLRGDLGTSILSHQPVWGMISHAFPITRYLAVFSLLIALTIAVPAGTLAALKRN